MPWPDASAHTWAQQLRAAALLREEAVAQPAEQGQDTDPAEQRLVSQEAQVRLPPLPPGVPRHLLHHHRQSVSQSGRQSGTVGQPATPAAAWRSTTSPVRANTSITSLLLEAMAVMR